MTTVRSCRMMLALMYGMIPSAKIENRSSAPPENMFTSPKMLLRICWKNCASACPSMPGVGIATPSRYTASAIAVNASRFRSSGTRGALANPSSTENLRGATCGGDRVPRLRAERVRPDRERVRQLPVGEALDAPPAADEPVLGELARPDGAPGSKCFELPEVDDRVLLARHGPEAALRQTALERHLAAFVARRA